MLIKIAMSSELKLLAGTKVYFCFNLKRDNFKVNQLEDAAKTNCTSETKCLAVFLMDNRWHRMHENCNCYMTPIKYLIRLAETKFH